MVKFSPMALAALTCVPLTACVQGTNAFQLNVQDLREEATVVNKFIKTICANPMVADNLSAADKTKLADLETKVQKTVQAMQSVSNQTLSINTGKDWAKSLIAEIQQILTVTQPIVQQLDPSMEHYLTLGQDLITILQAMTNLGMGSALYANPVNRQVVNHEVEMGPVIVHPLER